MAKLRRCKKKCDAWFLKNDPRNKACKDWCTSERPRVDTPPSRDFFNSLVEDVRDQSEFVQGSVKVDEIDFTQASGSGIDLDSFFGGSGGTSNQSSTNPLIFVGGGLLLLIILFLAFSKK